MDQALRSIWKLHRESFGGRTLLVVDETEGEISHQWFQQSSDFVILDADLLAKKRLIQKKSVSSVLMEARHSLIYAIKHGKTLIVRMSDSKTDFLNVFCDEVCPDLEIQSKYPPYQTLSYLPRLFLLHGGSTMITPQYISKLFHREDRQDLPDVELNKDKFCVIVTTTIPIPKVEMQLLNGTFGLPGCLEDYNLQSFRL